MRKLKLYTGVALQWIVLSPLLPPILLHMGCHGIANGIDWLFEDRWLTKTLVNASNRIEAWSWR